MEGEALQAVALSNTIHGQLDQSFHSGELT